jgi:hypothetical protein
MRSAKCLLLALLPTSARLLAGQPDGLHKPKLVLAIVVDQFRYDYLLRFRDDYDSGLHRLLEQGAVFADAHYLHAATVTATGHATFLSGAVPSVSGIIANEWFDRKAGQAVTSVSDSSSRLVGGAASAPGSSPRRLLVSTIPDELKVQGLESRVIGVSIKDRSAILPAGHMADAAYWYDSDSNNWVTSTYYRVDLPAWVREINAEHIHRRYLGAKWLPLSAEHASTTPFCSMVNGSEDRYCGGLDATPWGNEMRGNACQPVKQPGCHCGNLEEVTPTPTSCSPLRNSLPTAAESLVERHQVGDHRCVALREVVFGSELLTLRIQHAKEIRQSARV